MMKLEWLSPSGQLTTTILAVVLAAGSVAVGQDDPNPADLDEEFGVPSIADPFAKVPTLKGPRQGEVKEQALSWLKQAAPDAARLAEAEKLWGDAAQADDRRPMQPEALLEKLCRTLALGDPRVAELMDLCDSSSEVFDLPDHAWLNQKGPMGDQPGQVAQPGSLPQWALENLRLYYGRWLARERFYDESLVQLEGLTPEDVVDPATLLFYQAVVYRRLIDKEKKDLSLKAIDTLLEDVVDPPVRYESVAGLMKFDLAGLKTDSLDYVSDVMKDVENRLGKGVADNRVIKRQKEIIDNLNVLIRKAEEQQQQQQGGGGGGGQGGQGNQRGPAGGNQSSSPASDSSAAGGGGPGEVASKKFRNRGEWGTLDPKDRQKMLQDVNDAYPGHYRQAIEAFFKKQASSPSDPSASGRP